MFQDQRDNLEHIRLTIANGGNTANMEKYEKNDRRWNASQLSADAIWITEAIRKLIEKTWPDNIKESVYRSQD